MNGRFEIVRQQMRPQIQDGADGKECCWMLLPCPFLPSCITSTRRWEMVLNITIISCDILIKLKKKERR